MMKPPGQRSPWIRWAGAGSHMLGQEFFFFFFNIFIGV